MQRLKSFDFVSYFIYSNGTLVDEWRELLQSVNSMSLANRLRVQLSYDGEPHQHLMRGYPGKSTLDTFDMLTAHAIDVSLKATLSLSQLENLPLIWDSYYSLYKKFGDHVNYSPTLDLTDDTP